MFGAIAQNSNYFTATNVQEQAGQKAALDAEGLKAAKHEEATQQVRTLSGQEEVGADGQKKDSVELSQEAQETIAAAAKQCSLSRHARYGDLQAVRLESV